MALGELGQMKINFREKQIHVQTMTTSRTNNPCNLGMLFDPVSSSVKWGIMFHSASEGVVERIKWIHINNGLLKGLAQSIKCGWFFITIIIFMAIIVTITMFITLGFSARVHISNSFILSSSLAPSLGVHSQHLWATYHVLAQHEYGESWVVVLLA